MSKKAKGSLPYDRTDRESVYYYAIDLRGSTRREKTDADAIDDIRRNKGSFGSAVESCYFMLDANNKSEADFPEAELEAVSGGGWSCSDLSVTDTRVV